jgi:hypothetical protein
MTKDTISKAPNSAAKPKVQNGKRIWWLENIRNREVASMTWYAAHIIVSDRPINPDDEGDISLYENVVLISAKDDDEANFKAQQYGENSIVQDDTLTTMEGVHLETAFVGVRKIIEIQNPPSLNSAETVPVDGTEITYSKFAVKDEEALAKLVNGEEVLIDYLE